MTRPGQWPSVWIHDAEQVLVIERKTADQSASLVLLGFSKQACSVRLTEPAGQWAVRAHTGLIDEIVPEFTIHDEPVTLRLPPYGVCAYLRMNGEEGR